MMDLHPRAQPRHNPGDGKTMAPVKQGPKWWRRRESNPVTSIRATRRNRRDTPENKGDSSHRPLPSGAGSCRLNTGISTPSSTAQAQPAEGHPGGLGGVLRG